MSSRPRNQPRVKMVKIWVRKYVKSIKLTIYLWKYLNKGIVLLHFLPARVGHQRHNTPTPTLWVGLETTLHWTSSLWRYWSLHKPFSKSDLSTFPVLRWDYYHAGLSHPRFLSAKLLPKLICSEFSNGPDNWHQLLGLRLCLPQRLGFFWLGLGSWSSALAVPNTEDTR